MMTRFIAALKQFIIKWLVWFLVGFGAGEVTLTGAGLNPCADEACQTDGGPGDAGVAPLTAEEAP